MQRDYDPSAVETKWRKKWDEAGIYEIDFKKAKVIVAKSSLKFALFGVF